MTTKTNEQMNRSIDDLSAELFEGTDLMSLFRQKTNKTSAIKRPEDELPPPEVVVTDPERFDVQVKSLTHRLTRSLRTYSLPDPSSWRSKVFGDFHVRVVDAFNEDRQTLTSYQEQAVAFPGEFIRAVLEVRGSWSWQADQKMREHTQLRMNHFLRSLPLPATRMIDGVTGDMFDRFTSSELLETCSNRLFDGVHAMVQDVYRCIDAMHQISLLGQIDYRGRRGYQFYYCRPVLIFEGKTFVNRTETRTSFSPSPLLRTKLAEVTERRVYETSEGTAEWRDSRTDHELVDAWRERLDVEELLAPDYVLQVAHAIPTWLRRDVSVLRGKQIDGRHQERTVRTAPWKVVHAPRKEFEWKHLDPALVLDGTMEPDYHHGLILVGWQGLCEKQEAVLKKRRADAKKSAERGLAGFGHRNSSTSWWR